MEAFDFKATYKGQIRTTTRSESTSEDQDCSRTDVLLEHFPVIESTRRSDVLLPCLILRGQQELKTALTLRKAVSPSR